MKSGCSIAFASLLIFLGCESTHQVRSDYDKSADFTRYRTFDFVAKPSTDRAGYSSLLTQQLEAAVSAEMQQRGYARAANPDLLINFSGKLQKMQNVESTPVPAGPYYGYRTYGVWPGYANDVYTVNYTEGTLNIDLIDAARKQMVWEGVGVGELTQAHMQDPQGTIQNAVASIFAKYPFRAGQPSPLKEAEGNN